MLGGKENSEVEDFPLLTPAVQNTGMQQHMGFRIHPLPLDVTVRYKTWNQLHTVQYDVLFEFIILDPGTWNVSASVNYVKVSDTPDMVLSDRSEF